jgi:hypothetical protein
MIRHYAINVDGGYESTLKYKFLSHVRPEDSPEITVDHRLSMHGL